MRRVVFVVFLVCSLARLYAFDYGAIISGKPGVEGAGSGDISVSGESLFAPWFSVPLGNGDLYIAAGLNSDYAKKNYFIPELLQLEFSYRFLPVLSLRIGRIPWQDPSGFTVKGRMDGFDLLLNLGKIRFGAAALYTGLLYKGNAYINYNPGDSIKYYTDFDMGDFTNTYFAHRRLLTAIYGEFPGLPYRRGHLYVGLLAQTDLSGAKDPYHTQYLLIRHRLDYKQFDFTVAGAAELENTRENGFKPAGAFLLEGGWIPNSVDSRLSLGMIWASGEGPQTAAFFPVIREDQGFVLKPCFSGVMVPWISYEIRLLPSLTGNLKGSYFFRTDSTSYVDPDIEKKSYALGAEISCFFLWVPVADISFNLKGGVFLPKTGTAMRDNAPVRWNITLETIFSF